MDATGQRRSPLWGILMIALLLLAALLFRGLVGGLFYD